jgi:hypothetical protein
MNVNNCFEWLVTKKQNMQSLKAISVRIDNVNQGSKTFGGPHSKEKMLRRAQFMRKKLSRAANYRKIPHDKLN